MSLKSVPLPALAIACIAAVLLAGCTGPAPGPQPTPGPTTPVPTPSQPPVGPGSFDQRNDGGTYPATLGDEIQLRLPENPTTGFTWNLSVTAGLSVINDTYLPDDPSGRLVGSGGTHVWFLKAVLPGEQAIAGVYRRPWEPAGSGVTFFGLTLSVAEGSCGADVCTIPSAPPGVPARYHVYTGSDGGKTVEEPLGETFAIRLEENPTTGYTWNLSLPGGITLSGDEYLPASTAGQMVGGGGTRSFTLLAAKTGTWNITAEYRRPWVASGTVTYQDLEGGFYGILGDDGKKYDPLDLDARYQVDGLRVAFDAVAAEDVATIHMWGTPVNLEEIELIPVFRLRVRVG